ncbi:hypothetical protein [Streptomyces sioyaensis]|uniref:hypothetical protein n=1 Tax=Streptomyces sioyaensis TaxID=67364 RepID=UPI003790EE41
MHRGQGAGAQVLAGYGDFLSQADRVDYYRSQRDRRADAQLADQHQIVALARRLLAIPDQQPANRSIKAASTNTRAAELAERAGTPRRSRSSAGGLG